MKRFYYFRDVPESRPGETHTDSFQREGTECVSHQSLFLSLSLEREMFSPLQPAVEELIQFQFQTGDYNNAVQTLLAHRPAWIRDEDSHSQVKCSTHGKTPEHT